MFLRVPRTLLNMLGTLMCYSSAYACRRGREEDGKRVRRERYLICPPFNSLSGSKNIAKHVRQTYVLQQGIYMQEGP
jgi:hypothetical protein